MIILAHVVVLTVLAVLLYWMMRAEVLLDALAIILVSAMILAIMFGIFWSVSTVLDFWFSR